MFCLLRVLLLIDLCVVVRLVLFYIGLTIYFGVFCIVVVVRFGAALLWFVLSCLW